MSFDFNSSIPASPRAVSLITSSPLLTPPVLTIYFTHKLQLAILFACKYCSKFCVLCWTDSTDLLKSCSCWMLKSTKNWFTEEGSKVAKAQRENLMIFRYRFCNSTLPLNFHEINICRVFLAWSKTIDTTFVINVKKYRSKPLLNFSDMIIN